VGPSEKPPAEPKPPVPRPGDRKPKKPEPPDPQPKPDIYQIQWPDLPKLAPLIDLVGKLVEQEAHELTQTEAEKLVIEGATLVTTRTRADLKSVGIELGKLEAKMEAVIKQQTPKPLIDEFINDLFEKLMEIEILINSGNDGNGDGGPCDLPKMGPFARTVVAPADKKADGTLVSYDVSISEQKGDAYLEQMLAALFDHITILKGWRNYMAPKPNQGQPVTVIWEEILEE
jgi:hypothetical protein